MKTLLLAALMLSFSAGANARSILVFKTVTECQSFDLADKKEIAVEVQEAQEAQDGQSQLKIHLSTEEKPIVVQTKKTTPPPMMAGGMTKYTGTDAESKSLVTLSIGTRPMKVGKVIGRVSSIEAKGLFKASLLCSSVKN